MTPKRHRGIGRVVVALSALALSAAASAAPDDPDDYAWDQARVTGIAARLADAVDEIVADPGMSGGQKTAFQDRNLHAALVDLKQMAGIAHNLAGQLESGHSPEQTRPVFQQILLLRDGVRMYAENSEISPAVQAKARSAIASLDQLSRFYAPY
jgi:hypothetical protein